MNYAVFIPAGLKSDPSFVADTIDSALFYMGPRIEVFVGDDSGIGKFSDLKHCGPQVTVLDVPAINSRVGRYNLSGRLFLKKARLIRQILSISNFERIINLDDDALVIGDSFIEVSERLFDQRKNAGILGRYALTHEFQPLSYEGQLEKIYGQISRNPFRSKGKLSPFKQPALRRVLRPLYLRAIQNGYALGTSFIGGSWVGSRSCLEALTACPELDCDDIQYSPSGEDDLFTAFCYAAGFRVYDMLAEPPIFHIDWGKLTMSPEELVSIGASVIHSVRDPAFGGESSIRSFFRARRHINATSSN
jgi:hypothetical protein